MRVLSCNLNEMNKLFLSNIGVPLCHRVSALNPQEMWCNVLLTNLSQIMIQSCTKQFNPPLKCC